MMKTMIICFLIYVTHTLCASNGYRGVGSTHNESEATYGDITGELDFYKSRELKIEKSIAENVDKEVGKLLLEREDIDKSLEQHEVIMNCHSTETNRFGLLKATIEYNYANVIVDAMFPVFVFKDQRKTALVFYKQLRKDIPKIQKNVKTTHDADGKLHYNNDVFMTVLNGYSAMIDEGNFNWDEFMEIHYQNVGSILKQDLTKMTPVQTQLYYQTALLLRLLVVEKLFASHIKQMDKTLNENVLKDKYGWLQLPLDKTEKITDYVISYNGSEYTDALQGFYDFVCRILYFDEWDGDSIELANIGKMYSYYLCHSGQYISESYFKGFCRIFSLDNVINLLEERRKSYDKFYDLIGKLYEGRIKRETKKHKETREKEFDQYEMEIQRLGSELEEKIRETQKAEQTIELLRRECCTLNQQLWVQAQHLPNNGSA